MALYSLQLWRFISYNWNDRNFPSLLYRQNYHCCLFFFEQFACKNRKLSMNNKYTSLLKPQSHKSVHIIIKTTITWILMYAIWDSIVHSNNKPRSTPKTAFLWKAPTFYWNSFIKLCTHKLETNKSKKQKTKMYFGIFGVPNNTKKTPIQSVAMSAITFPTFCQSAFLLKMNTFHWNVAIYFELFLQIKCLLKAREYSGINEKEAMKIWQRFYRLIMVGCLNVCSLFMIDNHKKKDSQWISKRSTFTLAAMLAPIHFHSRRTAYFKNMHENVKLLI